MTLPNGPDGVDYTTWGVTGQRTDGNTTPADMAGWDQTYVQDQLKAQHIGTTGSGTSVFTRPGGPLDAWRSSPIPLPAIGTIIDNIVNMLLGWAGIGWTQDDSAQALADQSATLAMLSAQVAALQNRQNAEGYGGTSASVNFTGRANSPSIGSDFDQFDSGSGTSLWGITNGKVSAQIVTDNPRSCVAVYNAAQSDTDYQAVGAAFASAPVPGLFSATSAHSRIVARCNATGDTFDYVDLTNDTAELGCYVSGVQHVFTTAPISFKANGVYWLICGTIGGLRNFQVLEGSTAKITYTETGTTSQVGAGFRGTGIGCRIYADFLFSSKPGDVLGFAFADNTPAPVLGSGAEIFRTSSAILDVASGVNLVPANFSDTEGNVNDDITVDVVNGKFTVRDADWYTVRANIKTPASSGQPDAIALVLGKGISGGTVGAYRYGNDHTRGVLSVGVGAVIPRWYSGVWPVYLEAGDFVQLGYDATSSGTGVLTGEAGGIQTYFSIQRGIRTAS